MAEDDEVDRLVFVGADRFQLLVDAVEEYAIFMLDRTGRVASWNSGAQRIKGYTADEIIGRYFSVFYPDGDVGAGRPARGLAAAAQLGRHREEGWRVRKDGTAFWANVLLTAIRDAEGQLVGFAKVTRDDTERKASELAAITAVADAMEANASKDRFLSRMSHELRTPLNAILGFGQLLQMDELPPTHRDSVNYIIGAGNHLLALIDDVLDISRMESGEFRLSLEPVRVADVAVEAVGMLEPLAEQRGVPIRVGDLDPEWFVRADRQRLTQVVLNLLSNAIKYNLADGAVRLEAHADEDGRIRMSIHDDGPGIATDDIGRLFQPFERLGAAQTGIDGTGLGLTLSKTLINAMSGEIGVDSEVGRGSTFWIALPATHPGNVALSPTQLVQLRRDPVSTAPQTALYIDDNLPNVRLVERIFTLRPASTLLVATLGSSGIAMALEHRPDVILLDLHLPDMTGVDVLKRLRAEPATATTPIIIVSADATTSSPKRLRELGATDFITKPFDIRRLLDLVDAATGAVAVPLTGTAETAPADADHAGDAQPDQYIVDFVHDLNNTLSVIMNHSILLGHNVADPAAQAGLQQIQRSTELVAAQARALMEHARGRAGSADG